MTPVSNVHVHQLNPIEFPLHGSRLIEASAGTGKTFTIALLYIRLVLGNGLNKQGFNRPLLPREILVVTFTVLAAGELRDRIRARLVEAAEYFLNEELDADPLLVELRNDYPVDSWKLCAWRLQTASESIDEASISTIHGWCNRMLVEHAFDSRGLFDRSLETDTSDLLNEVVEDYWRTNFYPLDRHQAQLVTRAFASPGDLLGKVRSLLDPGTQGVSFKGQPVALNEDSLTKFFKEAEQNNLELQKAEDDIRKHWRTHWDEISLHLLELRPGLKSVSSKDRDPDSFAAVLDRIHQWLKQGGSFPPHLDSFAHGSFDFLASAKIKQAKDLPAFELTRQYNVIKARITEQLADLLPVFASHAAHWISREFQLRKLQQSCMTQNDLISELEQALDPERNGEHALSLAANIRRGFPIALIDEFQDTDPLQYRIFDRIYRVADNNSEHGILMIGDPKQSIYAFRGADMHSYLAVRAATKGRHYTLKKNFRSTTQVIEACNGFFRFAEQHDNGAFRYRSKQEDPIPFVEVDAHGRDTQLFLGGQPAQPLTLWHFDRDPDEEDDTQSVNLKFYIEQAAQQTASQIARWLTDAANKKAGFGNGQVTEPLQPADIAIIVRDRQEASAVTAALQQRNIRSVYLSDRESLFASQEASDCLHWLHACAEPTNERLVKTALGTVSMQIPLQELAEWLNNELTWETKMLDFSALHAIWRRQGVMVMLRRLMELYQVPERMLRHKNERGLTNLLHLAEWLQEASGKLDGEQALIRHLAQHLDTRDEENLLRLESDDQRIRILTIHKSKGLEFPLVVLPTIGSWKVVDGYRKQINYRIDGQRYIEVAGHRAFADGWTEANQERLKEDLRLLYVAMTRASYAIWLSTGPLALRGKRIQLHESAFGHILNGGKPFKTAAAVLESVNQLAEACGATLITDPIVEDGLAPTLQQPALEAGRPAPVLGNLHNWWIASYSALQFSGHSPELPTPPVEPENAREDQLQEYRPELEEENAPSLPITTEHDDFMHGFPRGAQWGTFLHGLLEWAALAQGSTDDTRHLRGFAAAAADDAERTRIITQRCRLRGIEEQADPLSEWLKNFITQPWPSGFALADIAPRQLSVELEFLLEVHATNAQHIDQLIRTYTAQDTAVSTAKYSQLNGMLKGFIDLIVEHQGRYYIIDWKSNHLGDSDADYSQERMQKAIYEHRYDVQYVLYTLALHRHLNQRLPNYDYEQHMGGAIYSFIRGWQNPHTQGLFTDRPPHSLIAALDQLFSHATQGARP